MNIVRPHFLFFLLLASFCFSCSRKQEAKDQAVPEKAKNSTDVVLSEDQFKTADIKTGKVEQRVVTGAIKANGVLDVPPQNLVSVSAHLGGFIKSTELLQGMKIKKGQVLAIVEGQEYIQLQEDYLNSKSQLEFLQLEFQRQQDLAKENVNAAKTLQQSRANYFSTKAKVEGLEAKLRLVDIDPTKLQNGSIQNAINIYAPISGFITQVNVNIGMHVNPADVMFKIVDTEHLHAEAQVFEKDISKLKVGQRVRLTLSNDSRERYAKVYLIGKEITPERTVRIHCHLDDEDPNLIPGMYFSAVIEVTNQTVPALPEKAIVTFEGKKYIFITVPSEKLHFTMKEIKTGTDESGYTEVMLSDSLTLQSPEVVTNGAYELLSKLKNRE